ncbi:MAG: ribosome biogenesis factor YjgA [Sterolibacterium sp.]|jgi:ribosome-associated protein
MIPVEPIEKPDLSDETGYDPDRPSKSQRKRDSSALQDLGEALVELPVERLAKIEMPDALRLAVQDARRITKHEARRRQMQYIGKLMRSTDPAPIQAALDAIAGVSAAENQRMHQLERLRLRLLEDEPAALAEIVAAHPGADLQQLRQLRRNALKEREQSKPPRAFREIYRFLKSLEEAPVPQP